MAGIALTGSIISHTPGIFVLNFASVIKAGYISTIQAGANPNEPIVWIQEEIIRMILIPVEVISNPFLLRSEFGVSEKRWKRTVLDSIIPENRYRTANSLLK